MTYKVKHIDVVRLLLITIAVIIGSSGTSIYLSKIEYLSSDNPLFFILIFGGIIVAFAHFFYWQHSTLTCEITDKFVKIDKHIFNWNELRNYKIRDDSPEFKTLKLKSTSGASFTIGHRKKHESIDEFEKFLRAFKRKVKVVNIRDGAGIQQRSLIWDSKYGKWYGYVMISLIIIFSIFMMLNGFKTGMIANYLVFIGISIPILFRIFKK